jgi:hypothetical protein
VFYHVIMLLMDSVSLFRFKLLVVAFSDKDFVVFVPLHRSLQSTGRGIYVIFDQSVILLVCNEIISGVQLSFSSLNFMQKTSSYHMFV